MALPVIPASGPIDFVSLRDGLGLTREISMSHAGVRSLAKKSSGSVSFSDIRNGGGLTAVKLSYQTPNFVTPSLYYILSESAGTTKVHSIDLPLSCVFDFRFASSCINVSVAGKAPFAKHQLINTSTNVVLHELVRTYSTPNAVLYDRFEVYYSYGTPVKYVLTLYGGVSSANNSYSAGLMAISQTDVTCHSVGGGIYYAKFNPTCYS